MCMTRWFDICIYCKVITTIRLVNKPHGKRSLVGCSPWGRTESDTIEWLHFHFSLSCIGEGNGNPLRCSCLENPRDGGAWWAAVYGVAQSQTRLKWLSSSSSSRYPGILPVRKTVACVYTDSVYILHPKDGTESSGNNIFKLILQLHIQETMPFSVRLGKKKKKVVRWYSIWYRQ